MEYIALAVIPVAYRLKGIGAFPRWIVFPFIGLVVASALCLVHGIPFNAAILQGALFVLASLPGHDAYFSTITGVNSGQKGPRLIDWLVYMTFPARATETAWRAKARGALGMFLCGLLYAPLILLYGWWRAPLFALAYAAAYMAAPYLIRAYFAVPPENSYNAAAEWLCGLALMLALL